MLNIILFIFFIAVLTLFGKLLIENYSPINTVNISSYAKLPINFLIGLGTHLAIAHVLAYLIHSYRFSSLISFGLMFLFLFFTLFTRKISLQETFSSFDRKNLLLSIATLVISIWCGLRGHFTDSDNTHIAWMNTIVRNNIYPPYIPVEKGYSLTFYHYGIDLIGASIRSITDLMSWDTISFQVAIGAFLVISSVFCFSTLFIKKFTNQILATLIICFSTSITSIEFFYKYISKLPQLGIYNFLHHWQNAGLTSVCDVPYYMVLISQSMGLSSILVIFILIFIAEKQNYKNNYLIYLSIILVSFVGYFCYSAFWYPSFIGLLMFLGIRFVFLFKEQRQRDSLINLFLIVLSFFLGKTLTLQFSSTSFGGIQALVFEPSLYWDHYAMNFLSYFDFKVDGNLVKPAIDYNSGKTVFQVHLFSWTTMRNFGFFLIAAVSLLIYKLFKKSLNFSSVLFLSSIPAIVVAFLFRFVPKYTEMYRFPSFGTVCLLMFIVINLFVLIESNENNFCKKIFQNKLLSFVVIFHLLLFIIPGLVATLPGFSYHGYASDERLDNQEKKLLKVLMKYQKTGDVMLTNKVFYIFCDFSSVAGFYGVGGQMYKPDAQTRATAIYLMNPILLRELGINYVLIYKDDKLSQIAITRLKDRNLFRELIEIHNTHPDYFLFEFVNLRQFTAEEVAQMQNEYQWIIGSKIGQQFVVLNNNGNAVTANSKKELETTVQQFRKEVAKQNIAAAVWLSAQAVLRH